MNKVKEGYKVTELGEIPAEWEVKKLQDIAQLCYGKSQKEVEVDNGKYNILGTGGIIGKTNDFLWNEPSVLIGRKGTIDKPQYIEEPFWTVDTLFYTKINMEFIAKWLYYYLNNIDLKKYNEATGVPSLSASVLNNIKISAPPLNEQKKISLMLSSVDEQIEITDNLIEKTKEIKKGLMQKLLTKGIGHDRFKETEIGRIPEEWDVKSIGEISELITKGTTPSTMGFDFAKDGINYIRAENINQTGNFEGKFLKISKECNEKLSRSIIKENDILISIVGFYLGKTAIVSSKEAPANTNQNLAIVRIINSNYFNGYIKRTFESNYLKKYIRKNLTEGAQPSLSLKQIGDFKIPIPNNEEQKKISLIISSVDEKIKQYEVKKEKLQELKKGLMQKLLTGKIRV